jgi:2'-5' RNA ligase
MHPTKKGERMETIRAFIAIELAKEIQTGLDRVLSLLRPAAKAVRWVPAGNIHLTLKFLGDTPVDKIELVKGALEDETRQQKRFTIQVGTLGAFPNLRRPRVIWVGVQAPADLANLAARLEKATAALGFPPEERPFSPHLTLGRVSQHATPDETSSLAELLANTHVGSLGISSVDQIHLFRSDLRPGGAFYTSLFKANLNTP